MIKKKGITLIEVLIALSILTVVMGIIFPFFISSFKGFDSSAIKSELQNESESVMRSVSNAAMESKGIKSIGGTDVNSSFSAYRIDGDSIKTMEILSGRDEELGIDKVNTFELKEGTLLNRSLSGKEISIGKNVKYIEIVPLNDATFGDSKGMKVTLVMRKRDIEYSVSNTLYFRNKR